MKKKSKRAKKRLTTVSDRRSTGSFGNDATPWMVNDPDLRWRSDAAARRDRQYGPTSAGYNQYGWQVNMGDNRSMYLFDPQERLRAMSIASWSGPWQQAEGPKSSTSPSVPWMNGRPTLGPSQQPNITPHTFDRLSQGPAYWEANRRQEEQQWELVNALARAAALSRPRRDPRNSSTDFSPR